MLRRRGMLISTIALACLLLFAGGASADRHKNESKQSKGKGKHSEERFHEDDYRGNVFYDSVTKDWSAEIVLEGRSGSVGVVVHGGSTPYPAGAPHVPTYGYPAHVRIPPGHLPPPGECRVWYADRPPGHQPPPTSCHSAERHAHRYGGTVVYGGPRH